MKLIQKLTNSSTSRSIVLIRLMVGLVFLSEGIQKFLTPETRGVGRFIKIGLPEPEFLAYFVASFKVASRINCSRGVTRGRQTF
jgi:uncharacterized membrane protein YphA (DoxX/SURF4 family)